jgi:hypothetical protein
MRNIGFVLFSTLIWAVGATAAAPPAASTPAAPAAPPPGTLTIHADGAMIRGLTGTFTGRTSYWKDTDGVNPSDPGCHFEYDEGCQHPLRRFFGEQCAGGRLIETNPEAGKCHPHDGDEAHPYEVDCAIWCRSPEGGGITGPKTGGRCVVVPNVCSMVGQTPKSSARCECFPVRTEAEARAAEATRRGDPARLAARRREIEQAEKKKQEDEKRKKEDAESSSKAGNEKPTPMPGDGGDGKENHQ